MQVSYSFLDVFQQYFAECIFLPLFVLALIWIVKKWNKDRKHAFIAVGCASILVFNEIVYRVFVAIGEGSTYYRLFWIIPIALVLAAFIVDNIINMTNGNRMLALVVVAVACVLFSGKTGTEWFSLPDNVYQIDKDVMQVSDVLMELTNGERTYLADDGSISRTIRQYNAKVMNTDTEVYFLDIMMQGYNSNVIGRVVQDVVRDNHSRYFAVKKVDKSIYKTLETGGLKLAAETDNYCLYYVDYGQLYEDYEERIGLEEGLWNQINYEYISISGLEKELEYVYVTDFGDMENEAIYQEIIEKIEKIGPNGIIINRQLSENEAWVERFQEDFALLDIPYYCNDEAFQVIENEQVDICMIDNSETVTDEALQLLEEVVNQQKPVVLVVSKRLVEEKDEVLVDLITKENSSIVQVLSVEKDNFIKELLRKELLQYAAAADEKQQLNIIRIESLEPKEIIAY